MADNKVQTKTIVIKVDAEGSAGNLKRIADGMGQLNRSVKDVQGSFAKLRDVFSVVAGASFLGLGIRDITQIADGFTLLESRINAFTGDASKTTAIMSRLVDLADEVKVGVGDVANTFARVQVATSRLNISTDSQIALTKILQQSFRLSGASAQEAASSTIQFTQALSSGQLRGQELRSILEQNAVLAGVFSAAAEKAGKSVFKFAEEGRFTNQVVFKLLADNFDSINGKADKLSQTFEQTTILAFNKFKVAIADLNKEFNINGKFAEMVNFILDNGPAMQAILTGLAVTTIPLLTKAFIGLGGYISAAALAINPLAAAAAILAGGAIYAAGGVKQFVGELVVLPTVLALAVNDILKLSTAVFSLGTSLIIDNPVTRFLDAFDKDARAKIRDIRKEYSSSGTENSLLDKTKKDAVDLAKALEQAAKTAKSLPKSFKEQIGDLNIAFNLGKIGVQDFNAKLKELTLGDLSERLKKGDTDLKRFNKELRELEVESFARELDFGVISIDQFNEKIRLFKIDEVKAKFAEGKLSVAEFTAELIKLQNSGLLDKETYTNGIGAGVSSYLESIGTLGSQIADTTRRTFSSLEDSIFEATKKGRLDFAAFTQGVLDDLLKIAIRTAIVKPLAEGLLGGIFGGPSSLPASAYGGSGPGQTPNAGFKDGGAFGSNGVQFFAKGGIVDSPTAFGFSGGLGVAGEAGPEAILPLTRSSNGDLGVKASTGSLTVNVINNAGTDVSARESVNSSGQKVLDIIIETKVKEGIARGSFDKTFQQSFGMKRVGF